MNEDMVKVMKIITLALPVFREAGAGYIIAANIAERIIADGPEAVSIEEVNAAMNSLQSASDNALDID